jgi:hypothetical protein
VEMSRLSSTRSFTLILASMLPLWSTSILDVVVRELRDAKTS